MPELQSPENSIARSACFTVPHRMACAALEPLDTVALDDPSATALATLIPLLGCGEEAAALAFDGLAKSAVDDVGRYALRAISADERVHDALLRALAAQLPDGPDATQLRRATRRFHINLGRGGPALHFARIAAVDAAVCTILSRLLRPELPLARDPVTLATFTRIRSDEVRHVAVSRGLAKGRASRRELDDVGAAARAALAAILELGGDAFESLGVAPEALFRDVAKLPDGMFSA